MPLILIKKGTLLWGKKRKNPLNFFGQGFTGNATIFQDRLKKSTVKGISHS